MYDTRILQPTPSVKDDHRVRTQFHTGQSISENAMLT